MRVAVSITLTDDEQASSAQGKRGERRVRQQGALRQDGRVVA